MIPAPLGLLAELTHRCPLGCPYCSNPLELEHRANELSAETWSRVFHEAAALGVLQVHLSGGEPASRRDLEEIVSAACDAGLYTNLITSAIGLDAERLARLRAVGLDHVQLSLQDVNATTADRIAGYTDAHERKLAFARSVTELELALTINAVIHRANIDNVAALVELAVSLGAGRIEIAHAQYYGWALHNRSALMPTREQVERAVQDVGNIRARHAQRIVIDNPRLLRPPAETMHGRLGAPFAECHALRSRFAVSRRTDHSKTGILVGERSFACRNLAGVAGISGIPRHGVDARTLPFVRDARDRFRRLPVSGNGAGGRCRGDRSGL
jgi:MoaA/NifB/PqqE/SkfB family radical SAM enzyme